MTSTFKRIAASTLIALAAGPFMLSAHASSASDAALQTSAHNAVSSSLGDAAKDVTVSASNGAVTLGGWINDAQLEAQARQAASKAAGATTVYSQLHVWSTENQ